MIGCMLEFLRGEARPRLETIAMGAAALGEPLRSRRRQEELTRALEANPFASERASVVALIYRAKNARVVRGLLNQLPRGVDARLWALDDVADDLAPYTVGSGRGAKFELLTKLLECRPINERAMVVVSDDDVILVDCLFEDIFLLMDVAGLGLAQPTHHWSSWLTHLHSLPRPHTKVSLTSFVEIGPIFIISPEWVKPVAASFRGAAMGWGLEARWSNLQSFGLRLGLVDECRMAHFAAPAKTYDRTEAFTSMRAILTETRVGYLENLMRRHGRWYADEPAPRWVRTDS